MKRLHKILGTASLGLAVMLPLLSNVPAIAQVSNPLEIIAQAAKKPEIILDLAVAKQAIEVTVEGEEKTTWKQLEDNAAVAPGDVLRYTIVGKNTGENPAQDLEVTQPIPELMTYKLDSASSQNSADITYSIDGGETFIAQPMIKVTTEDGTVIERPAPAEAYTHVRWNFPIVTPETGAMAMFEVQVQ